jgi:hypothetical protein
MPFKTVAKFRFGQAMLWLSAKELIELQTETLSTAAKRRIRCEVPRPGGETESIALARALDSKAEPEAARMLQEIPERVSDWQVT